ncbi:flavin-containing monooxygenase [Isoalcanivorax indicus]|uniref:flavin-containing monooxygenase n=1 Tax=Isoalcanivorax indicus TaxID=2202653 RepID=UPI000DBA2E7D|nr:NAD(P)/FAD-dependent oxidoreductase [Isoalcanivorax indicus]
MTNTTPQWFDVLIIGAGISGIGAAIRLREQGIDNVAVLEKADSLGGTWRDNTYPGCACDVPSALYSYSFAQKPDWSRFFAGQAEILDYVQDTARRHDVARFIRFGEPLEEAAWDEAAHCWVVRTPRQTYRARAVMACTGYLHEPIIPDLPGLQDFPGRVFHSSQWDHAHDLRGQRVAVIGTGASAIQFVPEIQPQVGELKVYQRTPQWILPKPDTELKGRARGLLRWPGVRQLLRGLLYSGFETFGIGFRKPALLRQVERLARAHIRLAIKDPVLREKVTPDYTLGCKRVLLSNDYYPALAQPNVEVFATGVREIRGNVIVADDGSEREVDTIILGTGFHVTDQPIAHRVQGASGKTLAATWAGSPQAYRGTTIHGFPNLFLVLGPNLAIGHNSAFIVIEAQIRYALSALQAMREQGIARLDVRETAQRDYNARVQAALQGTVWNTGGCSSYYIDANGLNSTGFPWSTLTMRRLLAAFDARDYDIVMASLEPRTPVMA